MLKITAIARSRPAPCGHWNLTVVNEPQRLSRTVQGINADLAQLDSTEYEWWVLLALLWLRGQLLRGATLAQCVNVEIVPLIAI